MDWLLKGSLGNPNKIPDNMLMLIETRIVTSLKADTDDSDNSRQKVLALFEKLGLKSGPDNFREASMHQNGSVVVNISKTDYNRIGIVNLSRKGVSKTVLGKFPTQSPFKDDEMLIAPVFDGVWCWLETRPLTRLEELAFEYMELRAFGTTVPIEADSPTRK